MYGGGISAEVIAISADVVEVLRCAARATSLDVGDLHEVWVVSSSLASGGIGIECGGDAVCAVAVLCVEWERRRKLADGMPCCWRKKKPKIVK